MMLSATFFMQGTALFLSAVNLFFYCLIRMAVHDSGAKYLAIFRSAVLIFFGQISYCMYMSHTYVMRIYDDWTGPLRPGNHLAYTARIAAVLGGTILISLISRYALELPFMSLRKYVLRKLATAAQQRLAPDTAS
jgi:peptidoglycan/LPS O-acetylase OafA/YrhL